MWFPKNLLHLIPAKSLNYRIEVKLKAWEISTQVTMVYDLDFLHPVNTYLKNTV